MLRVIGAHDAIETVAVCGMGTGVGRMDPFESARQMREAMDDWLAARAGSA